MKLVYKVLDSFHGVGVGHHVEAYYFRLVDLAVKIDFAQIYDPVTRLL